MTKALTIMELNKSLNKMEKKGKEKCTNHFCSIVKWFNHEINRLHTYTYSVMHTVYPNNNIDGIVYV